MKTGEVNDYVSFFMVMLLFLLPFHKITAQEVVIAPGNDTAICTGVFLPLTVSFPLSLDIAPSPNYSAGYTWSVIPNAPEPVGGTGVPLVDDQAALGLPVGFTFTFYGQNYTQFNISPNGWIGFSTPMSAAYTVNLTDWDDNPLAYPFNGILGVYQDFNPAGNPLFIRYQTIGTAPSRKLVVSFTDIPFFDSCSTTSRFQIHLYETTNIIEIHITDKPSCPGLWEGNVRSGLVAPIPGNPITPSCSEYPVSGPDQALSNIAYRYVPRPVPAVIQANFFSLEWRMNGSTTGIIPGPNSPTINAFMPSTVSIPRRYVATVQYAIPCGGTVVRRDTVVVRPASYDAAFTITNPVCLGEPALVEFAGNPVPPASATIAYSFGPGATPATANTPGPHTVSWTTPGTQTVSLTISGGNCATGTRSETVEIADAPTSLFTAPADVCGTSAAALTYTGNAPANATFNWTLDGGTLVSGTGSGPLQVSWTSPGTKTVSLRVVVGSCTSSVSTRTVNVQPPPSSEFTVPSAPLCAGEAGQVIYTGGVPSSASFTWNWDGGIPSPASGAGPFSVSWNSPGTKTVSLVLNRNGCQSLSTTRTVTVNAVPSSAFTVSAAGTCPQGPVTVTYTGGVPPGATYSWSWDGGSVSPGTGAGPHTVSWPSAGAKTIGLQVSANGCTSVSTTRSVAVNPVPSAAFGVSPTSVCVGQPTTLAYSGTVAPSAVFTWNLSGGTASPGGTGTGPQQVSWSSSGSSTVSLVVSVNGCTSAPYSQTVMVNPTPSATFNLATSVCPGEAAPLSYTGTGSPSAQYTWHFDGATVVSGSGGGPYALSWSLPGTRTVSLSVGEGGCSSQSYTRTITVHAVPSSAFTAVSPVCAGGPSAFTYLGGAGPGAVFSWNFDGGTPDAPNPASVIWAGAGTFFPELTVTENGCTSAPTRVQVLVNPIPGSDFTVNGPVCLDGRAQLLYSYGTSSGISCTWEAVGGTIVSGQGSPQAAASWTTPGTKTVQLRVTASGCVSGLTSRPVEVLALPVADAGPDREACSGVPVQIGAPGIPGYTYQWSPVEGVEDPGAALTTIRLENTSAVPRVHLLTLEVYNGQCRARDEMQYTVTAPLQVWFDVPAGQCLNGNLFAFSARGDYTAGSEIEWDFGSGVNVGGGSYNQADVSGISFPTAGLHPVSLQVRNGGCLSNLFTREAEVYAEPEPSFYTETLSGCEPVEVKYINTSQSADPVTYLWSFGAGPDSTATGRSPSFLYDRPGLFDVSLSVTTIYGCVASSSQKGYIRVYPMPKAGFVSSANQAAVTDPQIVFSASSGTVTGVETSYRILPVDTLLYGTMVSYGFREPGEFLVRQVMRSEEGCADSTWRLITVTTGTRLFIPNSFTPDFDGLNDLFKVSGEGIFNFSIQIFSRWGELVYTSYDMDNGWDGKHRVSDQTAPPGMYYYKVWYTDEQGFAREAEGSVFLIR